MKPMGKYNLRKSLRLDVTEASLLKPISEAVETNRLNGFLTGFISPGNFI
jgi:hypothetical protein